MSVKLESTIKRFIGLSTDTKPGLGLQSDGTTVVERDLPAGSSFLEEDTGRVYRWNGREWIYPDAGVRPETLNQKLVDLLNEAVHELRQLREIVSLRGL